MAGDAVAVPGDAPVMLGVWPGVACDALDAPSGAGDAGLGEYLLDRLDVTHVESGRTGIGTLIHAGDDSPNTCNRWLAILRAIMKAARRPGRSVS